MGLLTRADDNRAHHQGLLGFDEHLIESETGTVVDWQSGGKTDWSRLSERVIVGYADRRFVLLGQSKNFAADLVLVRSVELNGSSINLAIMYDTKIDRADVSWKPIRKKRLESFAAGLTSAVLRRRNEFPEAAEIVRAGSDEFDRREAEMTRLLAEPRPRQLALKVDRVLRVKLHTLAYEKEHVRAEPLDAQEANFCVLDDGRIAVMVQRGLLARFGASEITYLSVPHASATEPEGRWEIGYDTPVGERRLILTGPGLALFTGQLNSAADEILAAANAVSAFGRGTSWRPH